MKRTNISLAALALAVMTTVGVLSCQKEKTNEGQTTQQNHLSKEAVESIMAFKKQVEQHKENPFSKSSETINFEDAVWNVENVFNATYSQPETACSARSEFEFSLYLPVNADGNVLTSDLLDLYDAAVATARDAYANDGFTNKVFRFMKVDAEEPNNGRARLVFKGKTGERTTEPQYIDTALHIGPFGIVDYYHYDYGKCDGTGVDGADEMLTFHVGQYIASRFTVPPTGTRTIYLNPIEIVLYGCYYPNVLFYRTNVNATCIDFNNMNHLYQKGIRLITETLPGDPLSNVFGMTPIDFGVSAVDASPQYIAHDNRVTYSWRVIADLNDIGEQEDLLSE